VRLRAAERRSRIIQVPVTLVLLSIAAAPAQAKPTAAAPASARPSSGPVSCGLGLGRHLLAAVKEPVVWAPVAALMLVLAGVSVSPVLDSSLKLLGSTTGGVALFASGIILYAQRVTLSWDVIAITAARNVIVPGEVRGVPAGGRDDRRAGFAGRRAGARSHMDSPREALTLRALRRLRMVRTFIPNGRTGLPATAQRVSPPMR